MAGIALVVSGCATTGGHPQPPQSILLQCDREACVRVVSWNVHGLPFYSNTSQRMAHVAAKILEQQPDIVLLQEVWLGHFASVLVGALRVEYQAVLDPRDVTGWPRGGLVILVRQASRWAVSTTTFHRYDAAAPWYRLNELDGISGKGVLIATLSRAGSSLAIVDTHLQSQYNKRDYLSIRRAQMAELGQHLQGLEAQHHDVPILVGGDFNTDAREELYASALVTLGKDLTVAEREHCACGTIFEPVQWIDYVLARNWKVREQVARIRNHSSDDPYSDHDGLLVRLLYE